MRAAVIGIGSNSVRALVAQNNEGVFERLYRDREGTRLFAGLDSRGMLKEESILKTAAGPGRKQVPPPGLLFFYRSFSGAELHRDRRWCRIQSVINGAVVFVCAPGLCDWHKICSISVRINLDMCQRGHRKGSRNE